MRAYQVNRFGGGEGSSLNQTAIPDIAGHDMLVKVRAAAINQLDWKVQEGWIEGFIPHTLPLTLGWDVAGVVENGGNAVQDFEPGDEIFAMADIARNGSFAQYIVLDSRLVARKPVNLTFEEAAAMPLSAITAWNALFEFGQLEAGQSVLIHAIAGGVGIFAAQLAKIAGARVVGTCSAAAMPLAQKLGVDALVDYTREDFAEHSGFDLVIDAVGGETRNRSWPLLRPGGRMATLVPPFEPADQLRDDVISMLVGAAPDSSKLHKIAILAETGRLKPYIGAAFTLEQVGEALAKSRTNHMHGKIVITVD
ncbi:NADP-dependent oxidoreductase [Rhizorhabdus argentea]|uniref:NADP-dependent oxidoreductase n=1 Tax=Rhizorhabdus argentea TaxID=1387174 RepID=UPI0030EBE68C